MKWDFCSKTKSEKKYVVCNADEGDFGAFSDRYSLEDQIRSYLVMIYFIIFNHHLW